MLLDILNNNIQNCDKCEFNIPEKNKVIGFGSKNPKIFFVSEFPDNEEELLNEPFHSRDGKFFKKLLIDNGFSLKENYFGLSIKCCPDKKQVKTTHREKCSFWLKEQIKILKPNIIIPLGILPTKNFLNHTFKIEEVAGICFNKNIYPWYSIRYIFNRGKEINDKTVQFLKKIKEVSG